jgi:hypothetical protein
MKPYVTRQAFGKVYFPIDLINEINLLDFSSGCLNHAKYSRTIK